MDVDNLLCAVDGVEDSPVADGIFAEIGQVLGNRLMAEIFNVRRHPLCLVEQALGHRFVDLCQVLQDRGSKGEPIPGHSALPPQAELVRHLVA